MRQSGTFTPCSAGKFIQCGASKMSRASGGTIVSEDGLFHSTNPCLLTSMSDSFRCSFLSRDDRCERKILLKCVENMSSRLFTKNKRSTGVWIVPPGVFGNDVRCEVYTSSVNLRDVDFSGIKKNEFYSELDGDSFLMLSEGIRKGIFIFKRTERLNKCSRSEKEQ